MIGYSHKHNRVAHFRVDRLAGVEVLTTEFAQLENFDVAAYTNTMIDMFASEGTLDVELLCDNELMRVIIDHYGENVPVRTYDKDRFIATIKVNPSGTFYGWVFKFMGKIEYGKELIFAVIKFILAIGKNICQRKLFVCYHIGTTPFWRMVDCFWTTQFYHKSVRSYFIWEKNPVFMRGLAFCKRLLYES